MSEQEMELKMKVVALIREHEKLVHKYTPDINPTTLTGALLAHIIYLVSKHSNLTMLEIKEIYEQVWTKFQLNKHDLEINK
jgi:hypothetical protein